MVGLKNIRCSGQQDCACEEDVFSTGEGELGFPPLRVHKDQEEAMKESMNLVGNRLGHRAGKHRDHRFDEAFEYR